MAKDGDGGSHRRHGGGRGQEGGVTNPTSQLAASAGSPMPWGLAM